MGKKYRVGLIGVGSIAHIAHLPILAARNDVEMVGAFAKHKRAMLFSTQYIIWMSYFH